MNATLAVWLRSTQFKVGVCAAIVAILLYAVFIVGRQSVDASRGTRAAEGIQHTSEQVEVVTRSADAVAELLDETSPEASPEAVSSTAGTQTSVGAQTLSSDAVYVQRLVELKGQWEPRYTTAIEDIERLEHRFSTATDRLEEYFARQSELTQDINDPGLRAQLQQRDSEERAAYGRWIANGSELLAEILGMRKDLDDMNTVILKQELTVTMLNEYGAMREIPASVKTLYESLSDFRQQSDQLASDLSSQVFSQ